MSSFKETSGLPPSCNLSIIITMFTFALAVLLGGCLCHPLYCFHSMMVERRGVCVCVCVCACVRVTSPRWQREPMRSLEDSKFGVLLHGSGAFPATGRAGERNGIDGESVG